MSIIITHITISCIFFTVKEENRNNGKGKKQSRCQTHSCLTTYRSSLCVRARPCHLTFPLNLILQTLLATIYWFFILLNIPSLLIEFTPDYQCFKEASPPHTALPGSSRAQRGCTWRVSSISFSYECLREREDVEMDNTGKNEISLCSNLDQSGWVSHSFFFLSNFKIIADSEQRFMIIRFEILWFTSLLSIYIYIYYKHMNFVTVLILWILLSRLECLPFKQIN